MVYDTVDSEFPGYVYLVKSYVLAESIDDGKYNAIQLKRHPLNHVVYKALNDHRPAFSNQWVDHVSIPFFERLTGSHYSNDAVFCIRCLLWPTQAADWPKRHRHCGWPDSLIIYRVVSNGCDVVQVAHRRCRRDEWMNTHQHRLSFSRAEIVPLQLDSRTADCVSYVASFRQDRAIDREC